MATLTDNIDATQTVIPVTGTAPAPDAYFTLDSESVRFLGTSRGPEGRAYSRSYWSVERGIAGTTAASHSSGATLTRYYPDANGGSGGSGVTVDNGTDPPATVTTLVAPGAALAADSVTLITFIDENGNGLLVEVPDTESRMIRLVGADDTDGRIEMGVNVTGADIDSEITVQARGMGEAFVQVANETIEGAAASIYGTGALSLFTVAGVKGIDAWDAAGNVLRFGLLPTAGQIVIGVITAPPDGDLSASQVALWFDDTDGAAKLQIKGKSANGTVVTGSVNLS